MKQKHINGVLILAAVLIGLYFSSINRVSASYTDTTCNSHGGSLGFDPTEGGCAFICPADITNFTNCDNGCIGGGCPVNYCVYKYVKWQDASCVLNAPFNGSLTQLQQSQACVNDTLCGGVSVPSGILVVAPKRQEVFPGDQTTYGANFYPSDGSSPIYNVDSLWTVNADAAAYVTGGGPGNSAFTGTNAMPAGNVGHISACYPYLDNGDGTYNCIGGTATAEIQVLPRNPTLCDPSVIGTNQMIGCLWNDNVCLSDGNYYEYSSCPDANWHNLVEDSIEVWDKVPDGAVAPLDTNGYAPPTFVPLPGLNPLSNNTVSTSHPYQWYLGTWQGTFKVFNENYTFTLASRVGSRLYVDGSLVINNWVDQITVATASLNYALTDGTHTFRVDYFMNGQGFGQYIYFKWTVPNFLPTASNVIATQPDYCVSGPAATVGWSYSDAENEPQIAYEVQVDEQGKSFSPPIYDSGKIFSSSNSHYASGLPFNKTLQARVMVWDASGASAWSYSGSWGTPVHSSPLVSFSWVPSLAPSAHSPIQFLDSSTCYDKSNNVASCASSGKGGWSWAFGDGGTSTLQNPVYTYANYGAFNVTDTVTDQDGNTCSLSKPISIDRPIPIWKEVSPK